MTEKEFSQKWVDKIKEDLKPFPEKFVGDWEFEEIVLPGKLLFLPPPLFNSYQVIDEAGETIYTTDEHFIAKYIMYANRTKPNSLKIPIDKFHTYESVRDYEKHLDSFLKLMENDFKQLFPTSKGFKRNSIQVFNTVNLFRH